MASADVRLLKISFDESGSRKSGDPHIVDADRVFSVDNGALRIAPLIEPGWGRASLAYGPFKRRAGLAFAVFMLNGHNTAQVEYIPETLESRLQQWWVGCGIDRRRVRLRNWLLSGRMLRTLRLFRWWLHLRQGRKSLRLMDENLAVGWFADRAPQSPSARANAFIMHAAGPENGELWVTRGGDLPPVLRGLPNVPLYFVVVLRERGATYYAASAPAIGALPEPSQLRPLAIDTTESSSDVHAVLMQSTIGQIGFRLDSRVYGMRIADLAGWKDWYGSAHAADALRGSTALEQQPASVGGRWKVVRGAATRTAVGLVATEPDTVVALDPLAPSGLLHAVVEFVDAQARIGFVLELVDAHNWLVLEIGNASHRVLRSRDSKLAVMGEGAHPNVETGAAVPVQILLDKSSVSLNLGSTRCSYALDRPQQEHHSVGLYFPQADCARVSDFEAHPAQVALPSVLDAGTTTVPHGKRIVVREDFEGQARELDGKPVSFGGQRWRRAIGQGAIDITGDSAAKVRATVQQPNDGRTVFLVPWKGGGVVDLEMKITPPGTAVGQRHRSRAGFALWQDEKNHVLLNVWKDDHYGGASISTFFKFEGFEDLYDAVWVNVGSRVWYGREFVLRLSFDGERYLASVDGEPVLYRKLSDVYPRFRRLQTNDVGIVVNWEWGDDTGSVIRDFVARSDT